MTILLAMRTVLCALGLMLVVLGALIRHDERGGYPFAVIGAGAVVAIGAWVP